MKYIETNKKVDRKEMNREIEILKKLKHKNIVEYVGYLKYDRKTDILITEYCRVIKKNIYSIVLFEKFFFII